MTEREKMVAGKLYDPSDPELVALLIHARKTARRFNQVDEDDTENRSILLKELLPNSKELPFLQAPVQFDYGINTSFGKNCSTNFNFVCLDVCPVTIGDNVFIGPNVTLATPMHPLLPEERNIRVRADGTQYNLEYAKPIVIEDNCWIASGVTVCGGVTIGEGSVIGAGSVVTRDIPPRSIAAGNPCRVLRPLTDADSMNEAKL
ncbi:MAG: sugar O-acetyltransferase [Clostridia bacterium]|nr:sugar O-acetyltransferase [Clostridia bacterium]